MTCPKCKSSESRVISTRDYAGRRCRRRRCLRCAHRWTTYESVLNGEGLRADLRRIRALQVEINQRYQSVEAALGDLIAIDE